VGPFYLKSGYKIYGYYTYIGFGYNNASEAYYVNAVSSYQGTDFSIWNYGLVNRVNMYGVVRVDNINNNDPGIYNIRVSTNSRVYNNGSINTAILVFKGNT
jgi:hypothetical protein